MILRREHYQELSWWPWARMRLLMAWGRITGQLRRGLGLEESKLWQAHLSASASSGSQVKCLFCGAHGHKSFKSH